MTARIPSPDVAADVAGVRAAQNDTVAVIAPGAEGLFAPWTLAQTRALLTVTPGSQRRFAVSDETDIGGPAVAGFLMVWLAGDTAVAELVAVRQAATALLTRARFRRTCKTLLPLYFAWARQRGYTCLTRVARTDQSAPSNAAREWLGQMGIAMRADGDFDEWRCTPDEGDAAVAGIAP